MKTAFTVHPQEPTPTKHAPTPVRQEPLPFCRPDITEAEINEVVDTLHSGWLTTGPKTKAFEGQFADFVEARHAIAVNSCTGGLHIALAASGIGPGDEVIVPTMTFAATANVVVHQQATPILVDVEPDTLNLDPTAVERAITRHTRALIPVHLYGHPCALDDLQEIAQRHNLMVIEDAAHAIGAFWHGRPIGSLSDVTVFSFYATKNLVTAEGGMITTNDDELAQEMRKWVLHGISRDAWDRYADKGSWYYEVVLPGFKYNLTDLQAALGLRQLARLEGMNARRAAIAAQYDAAFQDVPEIERPLTRSGVCHAWHLYAIRLDLARLTIDRGQFIEALKREGICTSVHFIPLHRQPYYRDRFGLKPGDFPVADVAYKRLISLPLYSCMKPRDVTDVIEAVHRVVERHRV